jgi:hypothetical protein
LCPQSLTPIWNSKLRDTTTTLITTWQNWWTYMYASKNELSVNFKVFAIQVSILINFRTFWPQARDLKTIREKWSVCWGFYLWIRKFADQLIITAIKLLQGENKQIFLINAHPVDFFLIPMLDTQETLNDCIWNALKQRRKKIFDSDLEEGLRMPKRTLALVLFLPSLLHIYSSVCFSKRGSKKLCDRPKICSSSSSHRLRFFA